VWGRARREGGGEGGEGGRSLAWVASLKVVHCTVSGKNSNIFSPIKYTCH
jgi:hypothetical protein